MLLLFDPENAVQTEGIQSWSQTVHEHPWVQTKTKADSHIHQNFTEKMTNFIYYLLKSNFKEKTNTKHTI